MKHQKHGASAIVAPIDGGESAREGFATRSSQSPSANSKKSRLRRRALGSIAGLLTLSAAVSACTPDQMRAWFDAQGIDHSAMSQAEVEQHAAAATAWWAAQATTTTTAPATTTIPRSFRPTLPPFLVCVRHRESRGDYTAYNPSSGASGAFQFLRQTWDNTARHANRYDLVGVNVRWVSPADQDTMAIHLYQWMGPSPWYGGQWSC